MAGFDSRLTDKKYKKIQYKTYIINLKTIPKQEGSIDGAALPYLNNRNRWQDFGLHWMRKNTVKYSIKRI